MVTNAQFLFRELEAGITQPLYLVVGEEPFQAGEILQKLKAHFTKDSTSSDFCFESWDAEHIDAGEFLSSLNMMPGLFDTGEKRLLVCQRAEKFSAATLEKLETYLRDPNPTVSALFFASKVDKRKSWYKLIEDKGYVFEVDEPYDRDWPKWQPYFERKSGKRFDSRAWGRLVESGNRSLSLVWSEVQKAALYVGERAQVGEKDVELLSCAQGVDIFQFAEDIVSRRKAEALMKHQRLLLAGESEIKMLSILVRQFRLVDQCQSLMKAGQNDSKVIAGQIGVHPFFVTKLQTQAKARKSDELSRALQLLAECDFRLKTGDGNLFESFLVPYFSS